MMKIKKSSMLIMIVLVFLACVIALTAAFNYRDAQRRAERQIDATFVIQAGGQDYIISYYTLYAAGIQDFTADKKSDGKPAVKINYQGVPLKYICDYLGLDLSGMSSCVAFASDGYTVSVGIDKINDIENVFIATGENGDLLKKRDDGGDGPYMLVVVKDPFSQFWCKYLSEIKFK